MMTLESRDQWARCPQQADNRNRCKRHVCSYQPHWPGASDCFSNSNIGYSVLSYARGDANGPHALTINSHELETFPSPTAQVRMPPSSSCSGFRSHPGSRSTSPGHLHPAGGWSGEELAGQRRNAICNVLQTVLIPCTDEVAWVPSRCGTLYSLRIACVGCGQHGDPPQ